MCATPLINNMSATQQTQEVTNNNRIRIHLTNDCRHCFDELFSGIKPCCRPSIWKKVEQELNTNTHKKYYHDHIYHIDINDIINFIEHYIVNHHLEYIT